MTVLFAFLLGAIAAAALPPLGAAVAVASYLAFGWWRFPLRPMAARAMGQIWRLKWLFLATLACVAWPVPGRPLLEGWFEFLPSREGMQFALQQTARLLAVVLLYAALPAALDLPQRAAGFSSLAGFFGSAGQRLGLRLALTLHALESLRGRDCWAVLAEPLAEPLPSPMVVPVTPRVNAEELCGCGAALAVFLAAWLIGR